MSKDDLRRDNRFATIEAYQSRLNTKTDKFECIAVNAGKDGYIYLLCKDCGATFRKSKNTLRPTRANRLLCPHCQEIRTKWKEQKLEEEREAKAEEKRIIRKNKELEKIKRKKRICERCGRTFIGNHNIKYCSIECRRRQNDSNKEHRRRTQTNSQKHENISLIRLVERDNNKCWLCGKQVDWKDYTQKENGVFIAGERYPSMDHVKPLNKGGEHTWANVRLAHRRCNTKKRDRTLGEKNGQLIFFI